MCVCICAHEMARVCRHDCMWAHDRAGAFLCDSVTNCMCEREESAVWQDWVKSVTVTQVCGFVCRGTAGVGFDGVMCPMVCDRSQVYLCDYVV